MTLDERQALKDQLLVHEGLRLKPYVDTVGKVSIGVGHNLTDRGLSRPMVMALLDADLDDTIDGVYEALPWSAELPPVALRVLCDVAFNVGVEGLLKFKKLIAALQVRDYQKAADEVVNSALAPARAQRLAQLMRTAHG